MVSFGGPRGCKFYFPVFWSLVVLFRFLIEEIWQSSLHCPHCFVIKFCRFLPLSFFDTPSDICFSFKRFLRFVWWVFTWLIQFVKVLGQCFDSGDSYMLWCVLLHLRGVTGVTCSRSSPGVGSSSFSTSGGAQLPSLPLGYRTLPPPCVTNLLRI